MMHDNTCELDYDKAAIFYQNDKCYVCKTHGGLVGLLEIERLRAEFERRKNVNIADSSGPR